MHEDFKISFKFNNLLIMIITQYLNSTGFDSHLLHMKPLSQCYKCPCDMEPTCLGYIVLNLTYVYIHMQVSFLHIIRSLAEIIFAMCQIVHLTMLIQHVCKIIIIHEIESCICIRVFSSTESPTMSFLVEHMGGAAQKANLFHYGAVWGPCGAVHYVVWHKAPCYHHLGNSYKTIW